MRVGLLITCLAFALSSSAAESKLDYDHQERWQVAHGMAQSPIDIVTRTAVPASGDEPQALQLTHTVTPVEAVEDNGHAVEVETHHPEAMLRGRHFTLTQFHFHAQSEHTIDGKHYPLEGHFVFKAQDGRLAVIGVMYAAGQANPVIQTVLGDLAGHKTPNHQDIDIAALLPKQRGYYHYLGSLTTPPLTENVEWYVLQTPVTMSEAQLGAFRSHYRHNNRNVQPLNGRPLIHYQD